MFVFSLSLSSLSKALFNRYTSEEQIFWLAKDEVLTLSESWRGQASRVELALPQSRYEPPPPSCFSILVSDVLADEFLETDFSASFRLDPLSFRVLVIVAITVIHQVGFHCALLC
jgi:hypothetical protein